MTSESAHTDGVVVTFHSGLPGIGRTSTVVNTAVLLAGEGLRVLLVDADGGGVAEYLQAQSGEIGLADRWRPGLAPHALLETVTRVRLDPADRERVIDLLCLGPAPPDEGLADWLRAAAHATGYDYVLVDGPSGADHDRVAFMARLSDLFVACFPLRPSAIEDGADTARRIRAAAVRPIRFLPLAMRVDPWDGEALRAARDLARRRFAGLVDASLPEREIPYAVAFYYSETAVVVNEPPEREGGLRRAYEQLAETLTDGRFAPLREVTVLYTPSYRAWAEWIHSRIELSGVRVRLVRQDRFARPPSRHDHATLIVSPAGLTARTATRLSAALWSPRSGGRLSPGWGVWSVRVDDAAFPDGLADAPELDLRWLTEESATVKLRRLLRLTGPTPAALPDAGTPRFPRVPRHSNTLGRNPFFVGRRDLIEEMRDRLVLGPERRCLLVGEPGLGKSQIALEYGNRFGGTYDLVWWVSGDTTTAIRADLAALAVRLGLPTGGDAARAALRHLGSGEVARWLLVYDNVDDPALLDGLLPAATPGGHVIITSRKPDWPPPFRLHPITVPRFSAEESTTLIRKRVPGIGVDDAAKVAEAAAQLPMAVELAAAWLDQEVTYQRRERNLAEDQAARVAAARFLDDFDDMTTRLPTVDTDDELAHRVTVELALERLRQSIGPAGVWLAQACSFLSPGGIDLRFLRSPQMQREMERVDPRLGDPLMTDVVLYRLGRHGLARIDLGRSDPLRIHPLIQKLIQDGMSPEDRARRTTEILRAMAAYVMEGVAAEESDRSVHAELTGHVFPASAPASSDPAVRRWLIGQVRYHRRRNDENGRRVACEIGEAAWRHWRDSGDQYGLPELLVELSNAYRELGRHREAFDLAAQALRDHARNLGTRHPRTLITAMTYAVALRTLGDVDEAYSWDAAALQGFTELYGPDHQLTGMAMNNLAISYALRGHPREAIRLARGRVERRVRMFGEYDHDALWTKCNLACYLRDAGDYRGSRRLLMETASYLSFIEKEPSQIRGPLALRVESGLAITERMLGMTFDALHRDFDIIDDLRQLHGEDHIETLTCRHSLAADLYAEGRPEEAVEWAQATLADFRRLYGEHPLTSIGQLSLAVYLAGTGDLHRSRELGEAAHGWLLRHLGPRHPYTLAAAVNHAGTLVRLGQLEEALHLEREAYHRLGDMLGASHPYTEIAKDNLADTLNRLNADRASEAANIGSRRHIDVELPGI